jgi:DNA-binding LacI/PurR family transcriptional regulator
MGKVTSRTTIQDIANIAGVAKSTVSSVLSGRNSEIRVGEQTRRRIIQIADQMNYTPQASARALSTGRTYQLGFLLSSKVTLGLANTYFSTIMVGVQNACQEQGYNCAVSTYDLSSVENFVMPSKLRQQSVDGVVITGFVESRIIEIFIERQIPFVMVGDTTDFPRQGMLVVARDMVSNWASLLKHVSDLGHRRILVPGLEAERSHELMQQGYERFRELNPTVTLEISAPPVQACDANKFELAFGDGQAWATSDPATRATAVIAHDQWCVAFVSAIQRHGCVCPQDVSVISMSDTQLCKWFNPGITAVDMGLFECGHEAGALLIDLLEQRSSLAEAYRRAASSWTSGKLVVRGSTGTVPGMK